jgi:putative SOS response-associated peptidase YedK
MCYRYVLQKATLEAVARRLGVVQPGDWMSRYNLAPGEVIPVVRRLAGADRSSFEVANLRWGLRPAWKKEASAGKAPANARAESLASRPMFRDAFRQRRCLVPAGGFYEWREQGGNRQPYLFRMHDGSPLCFAGLWEPSAGLEDVPAVGTCAIVTVPPNEVISPIHDRMPAILGLEEAERWLDPRLTEARELAPLLHPFAGGTMSAVPVTMRVNRVSFDDPACLEPVPAGSEEDGPAQLSLGF